jgi:hypothetical protein
MVNNVNNPIDPGREPNRAQQVQPKIVRSGRAGETAQPEPVRPEQADTVIRSAERQTIERLAEDLGSTDEEPRREVIDRVRARIEAGGYESPDLRKRVASSLLDSGIL